MKYLAVKKKKRKEKTDSNGLFSISTRFRLRLRYLIFSGHESNADVGMSSNI